MAEPTNPGQPSASSTERGSPVNVNTSGNVTVTRKDVATGDVKSAQEDLLRELCACIEEQTDTLGSVIERTKKEIVKAVGSAGGGGMGGGGEGGGGAGHNDETNNGLLKEISKNMKAMVAKQVGGGGGEGGEPGGGGSAVAARAAAEEFDELEDVIEENRLAFKEWGKLFGKGVNIEFRRNIGNINKSLLDFGQSLADISKGWRKATDEARSIMEMGQGGLIDITALYQDLGAGLLKNRDALQASAQTVMEFTDQSQLLIGTLGNDLEQVSQALRRNRDAVDEAFGDDFLGKIPFEQQNEILTNILDVQRRIGVTADSQTILSSRNTRTQLEYLKEISFQTGQTVKEVMKLYKEEAKTFNQLEGLGLLQAGEGETTARNVQKLKAAGQESFVELLSEIIREGSVQQWMASDDANAAFASVPGNIEALNKALVGLKSGTNEGADAVIAAGISLTNMATGSQEQAGGLLRAFTGLEKFAGIKLDAQARSAASFTDVAAAKAVQEETTSGGIGQIVAETYNDIKEFLANNFGAGGDLAIALIANTAAVLLNTLAQAGGIGGLKGKAGGVLNKAKGMFGKTGGIATAARTTGGAIAGVGAATLAAGAAAGFGIHQAYQAVTEGRSDVNDMLNSTDTGMAIGDAIGTGIAHTLAFFGNEQAQESIDVNKRIAEAQAQKNADLKNKKIKAAEATKTGLSPIKGIAPVTPGDIAAVAPSDVVKTKMAKAPEDNPINMELIKHTSQFAVLIELATQGNLIRKDMLDTIGQGSMASIGKPSSPAYRRGAQKPADTFTELLSTS